VLHSPGVIVSPIIIVLPNCTPKQNYQATKPLYHLAITDSASCPKLPAKQIRAELEAVRWRKEDDIEKEKGAIEHQVSSEIRVRIRDCDRSGKGQKEV